MEYKRSTDELEDFAVREDTDFEFEWQLNRDTSIPPEEALKPAPEEESLTTSGPGTEYWLP